MSVIPLTIFFSLLLTGFFIALFAHAQRRRRFTSSESDSLLPLAEEQPRIVAPPEVCDHDHEPHHHDHHDHDDYSHVHQGHGSADTCGCRSGKRLPCPGCLKRPAQPASTLP